MLEGDLEQLLKDIKGWPHKPVNWSEKARFYKIRKQGGSTESVQNCGLILKEYLIKQGIDITPFVNIKKVEKIDEPVLVILQKYYIE